MDILADTLDRSDHLLGAVKANEFANSEDREAFAIRALTELMVALACSMRDREHELAVEWFAEGIFNCLCRLSIPSEVCGEARRFIYELGSAKTGLESGRPADGGRRLRLKEMCVAAANALFDAGKPDPYRTVFDAAQDAHKRIFAGRKFTVATIANWRNDGISKSPSEIEVMLKSLAQEAKREGRSGQFADQCLAYLERM